jgi:hypothetical protein
MRRVRRFWAPIFKEDNPNNINLELLISIRGYNHIYILLSFFILKCVLFMSVCDLLVH